MNINSIKKLSGNIISLALFYFVFLCSEYMFDNRMAVFTDSNGVVMAQSFILGSSVPGFLSYYFIDRFCDRRSFNKKIILCISGVLSLICMIGIYLTGSYAGELLLGIILFIVLGYFGSLIHTQAALAVKRLDDGLNGITQLAGISYGIGILLQLVHNNLIADGMCQVIFLAAAMIIMTVFCAGSLCEVCGYTCFAEGYGYAPKKLGIILILIVFAVTSVIVFAYHEQLRRGDIEIYSSVALHNQENVYRKRQAEDKAEITVYETVKMTDDELLELFVQKFHLTPREGEVLDYLLHSDESMQDVAKQLAVSRAALYRHIANMNEKTQTKARMGLVQFYYSWTREKQ